jgi:hypothetical protein
MKIRAIVTGIAFFGVLLMTSLPAFSQGKTDTTKTDTTKTKSTTAKTSATATKVSPSDIQTAKAAGKVWVNTETKVYHKDGKFYGNTKHGKFMTEDEAKKAGYRAAKGD